MGKISVRDDVLTLLLLTTELEKVRDKARIEAALLKRLPQSVARILGKQSRKEFGMVWSSALGMWEKVIDALGKDNDLGNGVDAWVYDGQLFIRLLDDYGGSIFEIECDQEEMRFYVREYMMVDGS